MVVGVLYVLFGSICLFFSKENNRLGSVYAILHERKSLRYRQSRSDIQLQQ